MAHPEASQREWQTRKRLIDPKLKAQGWDVAPFKSGASNGSARALTEYPTDNGPADYALCVDGQRRRHRRGQEAHARPAERPDPGRAIRTRPDRAARSTSAASACPFLYSTNGEVIWFHDVRHPLNRSRRVAGFHTPARPAGDARPGLRRRLRLARSRLPNDHPGCAPTRSKPTPPSRRPSPSASGKMLVAMATGTGKTFTLVNQVYRLMKSASPGASSSWWTAAPWPPRPCARSPSFEPEPGLKFDQIYEVYSQRFQREDFDEDEKFDPKVLPSDLPDRPAARPRLRLRLHDPAHGDQPVRPAGDLRPRRRGRSTTMPTSSTSRSTPST